MKKLPLILFSMLLFSQCQEEKSPLQQAAEIKCECLKSFDPELGNLMEALNCSDEISANPEFSDLDPIEISNEMEKICPNTSLPFDQIQQ